MNAQTAARTEYVDGAWYVAGFRDAHHEAQGFGEYRFEQFGQFCADTGTFFDEDGEREYSPATADVLVKQS